MKRGFCILLTLVLVLSLTFTGCDAKKGDYDKANELFGNGEYEAAKEAFLSLGDYEDSAEMAEECDYKMATALLDNGEYDAAKEVFLGLGDYKDSGEVAEECDYKKANELFGNGEYDAAKEVFLGLGDYKDSGEMAEECDYAWIYGTWEVELDVTPQVTGIIVEMAGGGISNFIDPDIKFPMKLSLAFEKDKTCVISCDPSGIGEAVENWKGTFADNFAQWVYDEAAKYGVSRDEAEENLMLNKGYTISEVAEMVLQPIDTDVVINAFAIPQVNSFFRIADGNKLYITETEKALESPDYVSYMEYSIDGDTMKLGAGTTDTFVSALASLGLEVPLTLTRK